jgi:Rps23 Pro-64 3,4-dihydroxylase Tpa1-like proline 4-hydroxylase
LEQLAEFPLDRLQLDRAFPDLEYLHGAGMHQLSAGESLGRHLDTERHPILPWKREATAIIYLDTPESGGELVFTSDDGYVQKEIAPKENRLVLFKTSGQWHQVNKCESTRRSICLFFWSICDETFQGNQNAKFVDY